MNPRPFSITVLSVLGIVFGCLYLVCCSCQTIEAAVSLTIPGSFPDEAKVSAMSQAPIISLLILGLGSLQLIMATLLVVCSVGSLALKPWARSGMLLWAGMNLFLNAAILLLQAWVGSDAALDEAMAAAEAPLPREGMMALVLAMILIFYLITAIYPICVMVFFNTEKAKRAFDGQGPWQPPAGPGSPMQGYGYGPPQQGGYYPSYEQQQYGAPQYPPYDPNVPSQGYPPYPPPDDRSPQG